MPRLAPPRLRAFGDRFSRLLHSLIFSFPSPSEQLFANRTDALNSTGAAPAPIPGPLQEVMDSPLMKEPGEPRAIAGGIGPLSFAGSGYGLMLAVMAILLNRIHHIVQRPRPPPPPLPRPPAGWYRGLSYRISRALSSPKAPNYVRVPGIIGLVRAWILFSVLTLQVAQLWPVGVYDYALAHEANIWSGIRPFVFYGARTLERLGEWAGEKEMANVCWSVFLCVCLGLVCGALANGLDRVRRRDVGTGFNLFGFSFLLHLYSSPLTHHHPPPSAHHGRPDVHALFQLWLGLTELAWLQIIELSPSLRRNQLLPTSVCGCLGLVHFMYAITTAPLKFPSFTFLTHLMALFLSIIILCTIILRAFTHMFTLGYLPSPIWANLLPHAGAVPSVEDDFGVALLKLGTACIEATSYSGLRNELAAVEQTQPWIQLSQGGCDKINRPTLGGGLGTRIDDIHVTELEDPNSGREYSRELVSFWNALTSLASDMFWAALLSTPVGRKFYQLCLRIWSARWWYGPRQWRFWRRAAWAAPPRAVEPRQVVHHIPATGWSSAVQLHASSAGQMEDYTYDQVLRGEVFLDENDEDDDDWRSEASDSSARTEFMEDDEDEQAGLFRDLVVRETGAEDDNAGALDIQPILLAHLTQNGSGPLTRRRYAAISSGKPNNSSAQSSARPDAVSNDVLAEAILQRRSAAATNATPQDEWDAERRHSCVVCMVQDRDVILWPCRCLLMCNDCRESLAARLPAKDHNCPNCRTKVDGFSRIFVP